MNIYLAVSVLFSGALIQSSVAPHFTVMGVKPGIVLALVVSWSILRGAAEGVTWGFIGGLALDLFSGAPLGMSALSLMLVGFLTNLGENTLFKSSLVLPLIAVFGSSFLHEGIQTLLLQAMGWDLPWLDALTRIALPSAVLNTVLMPVVHLLLQWLHRRTRGEGELQW